MFNKLMMLVKDGDCVKTIKLLRENPFKVYSFDLVPSITNDACLITSLGRKDAAASCDHILEPRDGQAVVEGKI